MFVPLGSKYGPGDWGLGSGPSWAFVGLAWSLLKISGVSVLHDLWTKTHGKYVEVLEQVVSVPELSTQPPAPAGSDFSFRSTYGWSPNPLLLGGIASYHALTITELMLC